MAESKRKLRKRYILLAIIVLLVGIRISLPYFLKSWANSKLENMGQYSGQIEDVDLHLYRGAYKVKNFVIHKTTNDIDTPFVYCPMTDLSIEWKSLLKGKIVGVVEMDSLDLNFFLSDDENKTQTGASEDWVQIAEDITPIDINKLSVRNSNISYAFTARGMEQRADLSDVNLIIENIRNVVNDGDSLPSDIKFTAFEKNFGGSVTLTAEADFMREFPNFDYNAEMVNMELTSLNPLFRHYTKMDFERGVIDLFSEMAVRDEKVQGYFKPIIEDAVIFRLHEEDRSFFSGVKEFFAEIGQEILENPSKGTTATKLEYKGTITEMKTNYWTSLVVALRNAYWEALVKQIDNSIEYGDIEVKKASS